MTREKYMSLVFCRIKESYYALEAKDRTEITHAHVNDLNRFGKNISHLVTTGFNGQYDQVALIESDNLKTIYDAVEAFKLGKKGQHIEVVDAVFGIKVENKSDFEMIGKR